MNSDLNINLFVSAVRYWIRFVFAFFLFPKLSLAVPLSMEKQIPNCILEYKSEPLHHEFPFDFVELERLESCDFTFYTRSNRFSAFHSDTLINEVKKYLIKASNNYKIIDLLDSIKSLNIRAYGSNVPQRSDHLDCLFDSVGIGFEELFYDHNVGYYKDTLGVTRILEGNSSQIRGASKVKINNRIDSFLSELQKVTPGNRISTDPSSCGVIDLQTLDSSIVNLKYFIYNPLYHSLGITQSNSIFDTYQQAKNTAYFPELITNGGMFHSDYSPVGLLIIDGREVQILNSEDPANGQNFYLMPNGVCYISNNGVGGVCCTRDFQNIRDTGNYGLKFATQSGPMLIINGNINDKFLRYSTNCKIRSGVGQLRDGRLVFLISETPISFYDFSSVFKCNLGCKNALFLDGVISKGFIKCVNSTNLNLSKKKFGVIITVKKK